MRTITHFALVMGGILGVAACNPGTAKAHPQKNQPVTATEKISAKNIDITKTDEMTDEMVAEQSDHIIEIHKMKFQTKLLDVKIGDTVTWVNKDIVPHTATAKDKSWDSGQLKKGESFTLTITDQTGLDYFCFYHRQMKAKLVLATSN